MSGKLSTLFILALLAVSVSAQESQNLFQPLWTADLRGEVRNLAAKDIDGDLKPEIFADVYFISSYGTGGRLMQLDYKGEEKWSVNTPFIEDSDTGDAGYTVVGDGPYAKLIDPNGVVLWKYGTRGFVAQKVYGQAVLSSDIDLDGVDEAIIGTRYGKTSELKVLSKDGDEIMQANLKGSLAPYKIMAADITGTQNKEIVVGTVLYTVNSIAGTMEPAISKPSELYAFSSDGSSLWQQSFESAVTALTSCDLDGDGKKEVIVGVNKRVAALRGDGSLVWSLDVKGSVKDLVCADLESDGKADIGVAAAATYVIGSDGEEKLEYTVPQAYSIQMADLSRDGFDEIIIGSGSIRIIDHAGKLLYKSENYDDIHTIDLADLDGDAVDDIIYASVDHNIRTLSTASFAVLQSADTSLSKANKAYSEKDYEKAKQYAQQAIQEFKTLNNQKDAEKAQTIINKANAYESADAFYNQTLASQAERDWPNTRENAQKAIDFYKKVSDLKKINELTKIKNTATMIPEAHSNLNISRQLMDQKQYVNATAYAEKAKSAFDYLQNEAKASEAAEIISRSDLYLRFQKQIDLAYWNATYLEYGMAQTCIDNANATYQKLGDESLKKQLENVTAMVQDGQAVDKTPYVLGGLVFVLILGLVGIVCLLVLYLIYTKSISNNKPTIQKEYEYRQRPAPEDHAPRNRGLKDMDMRQERHHGSRLDP